MSQSHLAACPWCARHVRVSESTCPFCRSTIGDAFHSAPVSHASRERLTRAAAFALGAALTPACSPSQSLQPPYGAVAVIAEDGGNEGGQIVVDASTDADGGPNVTPGQCVLSGGVWYCGAGYGNISACPDNTNDASCGSDAGTCFICDEGAGETYGCVDGGWVQGLPTETGCRL
jgi:hypothetical protein